MARKLISVKEAAEQLGISETKVRELCYAGDLPSIKMGDSQNARRLIPVGKIDEWIDRKIREQKEEKEDEYGSFAIKPFERRGSGSEVRLRANR